MTAVGVSNFSVEQTLRAHEALAARGIPLAANQVGYSLLNRSPERPSRRGVRSLVEVCAELGVTVVAYGPLAEGLLTGKYGPDSPPPLARRMRYARRWLPKLPPLTGLLSEVATAHPSATPAQVALNWLVAKGAVPIPGIKNAVQAADNAAAMTWQLSPDEVAALDRATEGF